MATYKVIQDIEAEDTLVGPLTLRQFIYAAISAVCLYICFLSYSKGVVFLIPVFLPIAVGAGFFAFPWKGEQPTEIWALARLRFMLKPRVRIWDQDGVKDLVTVLAPKRIERRHSNKANLTQNEVRSRLRALANTIDSRGWATRNAAYGIYGQQWTHPTVVPVPGTAGLMTSIPDDMFDETNSVAQNFDAMLSRSSERQRQRVVQQISQTQQPQAAVAGPYTPYPYPDQSIGLPSLPSPIMPIIPTTASASVGAPQPIIPTDQSRSSAYPSDNYWFTNGPAYPSQPAPSQTSIATATLSVTPQPPAQPIQAARQTAHIESDIPLSIPGTPTPEEERVSEAIRQQNQVAMSINYSHMRVLQPSASSIPQNLVSAQSTPTGRTDYAADNPQGQVTSAAQQPVSQQPVASPQATQVPAAEPVTRKPDPAILELANNDDLDIATIARQASKEIKNSPDEVEIQLH